MKKRMIIILGLISITLFILSLSIAVTINFTTLYAFDIGYLSISESINMSRETILLNYRVLMEYLNSPWVSELAMPDFPSSERGLFHFVEVKRLFLINYSILLVSGIGTGVNLAFYPEGIHLTGIDFSPGMLNKARKKVEALQFPYQVDLIEMDIQ